MISAFSKGVPRALKARAQLPISAIRETSTGPIPRKEVPFQDTWKSDDPERMAAAEARDKVRALSVPSNNHLNRGKLHAFI